MLKKRSAALLFFFAGVFCCSWDLVLKMDLAGFTLKAHQGLFFFALTLACLPKLRAIKTEIKTFPLKSIGIPFLILAVYYSSTAYRSEFPLKSFLYSGWLLFNLCTIWVSCILLRDRLTKKALAFCVFTAAVFQALIIIVDQVAFQFGFRDGLIGFNQDSVLRWGVSRPHGFAMEPSYAAIFLTFGLFTGLGLFRTLTRRLRYAMVGALILVVFALVASTSRSGWLSSAAGLFTLFTLDAIRAKRIPWKELMGALLAGFVTAAVYYASISDQQRSTLSSSLVRSVYEGTDGSGNARLRAHGYAWQMAKETHWLGTGLGASYKYWVSTRKTSEPVNKGNFDRDSYGNEVIMSIWGQLLAEGGIPALLLYAAGAFFLTQAVWLSWRATGDPLTQAALASAIVFFCFTAFWLGNVARGDVWVWFAVWSRMALPEAMEQQESLS